MPALMCGFLGQLPIIVLTNDFKQAMHFASGFYRISDRAQLSLNEFMLREI